MLAIIMLLSACSTSHCMGANGPPVDFVAAHAQVSDAFAPFSGVVTDAAAPRDGVEFVPCEFAGSPFTVSFEVSAPSCIDSDDPNVTCDRAWEAGYRLDGILTIDGEPSAVSGDVSVMSMDDGLFVRNLEVGIADGPAATGSVDLLFENPYVDTGVLEGLTWSRGHSEDGAATAVWESCELLR